MEHPKSIMTRDLLEEHGIPFTMDDTPNRDWLVVPGDKTEPSSLRDLGFRLGHGAGDIQYLIYFRGRFCGIMM